MSEHFIINSDIQVNLDKSEVQHRISGRTYRLGSNEVALLMYFFQRPNVVLARQELIEQVWLSKGIHVEDGSLMQTISVCRKALEDSEGKIIVTERGKGYIFSAQLEREEASVNSEQSDTRASFVLTHHFVALLVLVTGLTVFLSYSYFSKSSLKPDAVLEIEQYSSCKIETDSLSFSSLDDVTLYRYNDKQILVDREGRSFSFPPGSEEVNCD
ncbi:winged helix-turn-helix domain-containing protein [Vibrio sp. SCSIO 43135]|uniref:winged helix-turn-helix domain-containing protein n=1 Tax=Vibrio sp. SCSIO 43135 TaxID=2819096 RepID=UPI002075D07B|nr:winged helix-turn-helix domain-containing protein [Vibrio sp. SCSIO 43135]USD43997.1 winged helix-turn-helix domain-containing protein [Vibrio sp. SCSIO 43135]